LDFHVSPPFVQVDPVTGLPNRQKFVQDFFGYVTESGSLVMVTVADAKHFNEILRALGHEWSDEFVCEGAARVRAAIPKGATLYHVSVLSFAFLYHGPIAKIAAAIQAKFNTPIYCQDIPVVPRLGIGAISCASLNVSEALRAGLVAAQESRSIPQGWAIYDPSKDNASRRGFVILSQLSSALASGDQLHLVYQPKIDFASGRLAGAEALLRWNHPSLGHISPAEFIPLAETTDHVHRLTDWVLNAALAQSAEWRTGGLEIPISINVSPLNLSQRGFAAGFIALLEKRAINPADVELEFTEGVLATNNDTVVAELAELRAKNINIALDDFGTGFSNLGYISRLPANILKIDRSLVLPIAADRRSALVVQSLIALAHQLDYRVVAEGIETAAIYAALKSWDCDDAQGYFISRPLTAPDFAKFATPGLTKLPTPLRPAAIAAA
jgi:EAL domain-containing protein (putative c-di-GMP-specific phosphodiesterase class I)/GGDEF domain-containing protein